jgi:hypothetical protein
VRLWGASQADEASAADFLGAAVRGQIYPALRRKTKSRKSTEEAALCILSVLSLQRCETNLGLFPVPVYRPPSLTFPRRDASRSSSTGDTRIPVGFLLAIDRPAYVKDIIWANLRARNRRIAHQCDYCQRYEPKNRLVHVPPPDNRSSSQIAKLELNPPVR